MKSNHAESTKEAHFNDLRFGWIEPRQPVHRVIERYSATGFGTTSQPRAVLLDEKPVKMTPTERPLYSDFG